MGRVLTKRTQIGGSFTKRWSGPIEKEKIKEMRESSPTRSEVDESIYKKRNGLKFTYENRRG